ncbi:septum formation family protein [Kineosporia succinea]|uniref:Septum formation-related domain-containing protein n=1 Tax=Kineosporia succinea TaxID=84632 RepID=A0ABT9PB16_9ACTN|nr:septum formation family protein [Kineosporia succinea]MDP9829894.1 hypothetical protein [Kineosporia succinea]
MKRSAAAALIANTAVFLSLSACSSGGDEEWASELQPSDCAVNPADQPGEITRVRVVPCTSKHDLEVFGRIPYRTQKQAEATTGSDQEYPGRDVLMDFAREECAGAYRPYLDGAAHTSNQFLTYLYPSVESWNAVGADSLHLGPLNSLVGDAPEASRDVVCIVRTTDGLVEHSVRALRS